MLRGWVAVNDEKASSLLDLDKEREKEKENNDRQQETKTEGEMTDVSVKQDADLGVDIGTQQQEKKLETIAAYDESSGDHAVVEANKIDEASKIERVIEDSIEVQEANASRLYTEAIALFRTGVLGSVEWKKSREKFSQVLEMKLIRDHFSTQETHNCNETNEGLNVDARSANSGFGLPPLLILGNVNNDSYLSLAPRLKYMCLQNLGHMDTSEGDLKSALTNFSEALSIDDSDICLWLITAKAAGLQSNHRLARYCFEQGLRCNPENMSALGNAMRSMCVVGDDISHMKTLQHVLRRDPKFLEAWIYKILGGKVNPDDKIHDLIQSLVPPRVQSSASSRNVSKSYRFRMERRLRQRNAIDVSAMEESKCVEIAFQDLGTVSEGVSYLDLLRAVVIKCMDADIGFGSVKVVLPTPDRVLENSKKEIENMNTEENVESRRSTNAKNEREITEYSTKRDVNEKETSYDVVAKSKENVNLQEITTATKSKPKDQPKTPPRRSRRGEKQDLGNVDEDSQLTPSRRTTRRAASNLASPSKAIGDNSLLYVLATLKSVIVEEGTISSGNLSSTDENNPNICFMDALSSAIFDVSTSNISKKTKKVKKGQKEASKTDINTSSVEQSLKSAYNRKQTKMLWELVNRTDMAKNRGKLDVLCILLGEIVQFYSCDNEVYLDPVSNDDCTVLLQAVLLIRDYRLLDSLLLIESTDDNDSIARKWNIALTLAEIFKDGYCTIQNMGLDLIVNKSDQLDLADTFIENSLMLVDYAVEGMKSIVFTIERADPRLTKSSNSNSNAILTIRTLWLNASLLIILSTKRDHPYSGEWEETGLKMYRNCRAKLKDLAIALQDNFALKEKGKRKGKPMVEVLLKYCAIENVISYNTVTATINKLESTGLFDTSKRKFYEGFGIVKGGLAKLSALQKRKASAIGEVEQNEADTGAGMTEQKNEREVKVKPEGINEPNKDVTQASEGSQLQDRDKEGMTEIDETIVTTSEEQTKPFENVVQKEINKWSEKEKIYNQQIEKGRNMLSDVANTLGLRYMPYCSRFVKIDCVENRNDEFDVSIVDDYWKELTEINPDLNEDEFELEKKDEKRFQLPVLGMMYICSRESRKVVVFIALAVRILNKLATEVDESITTQGIHPGESPITLFLEVALKTGIIVDDYRHNLSEFKGDEAAQEAILLKRAMKGIDFHRIIRVAYYTCFLMAISNPVGSLLETVVDTVLIAQDGQATSYAVQCMHQALHTCVQTLSGSLVSNNLSRTVSGRGAVVTQAANVCVATLQCLSSIWNTRNVFSFLPEVITVKCEIQESYMCKFPRFHPFIKDIIELLDMLVKGYIHSNCRVPAWSKGMLVPCMESVIELLHAYFDLETVAEVHVCNYEVHKDLPDHDYVYSCQYLHTRARQLIITCNSLLQEEILAKFGDTLIPIAKLCFKYLTDVRIIRWAHRQQDGDVMESQRKEAISQSLKVVFGINEDIGGDVDRLHGNAAAKNIDRLNLPDISEGAMETFERDAIIQDLLKVGRYALPYVEGMIFFSGTRDFQFPDHVEALLEHIITATAPFLLAVKDDKVHKRGPFEDAIRAHLESPSVLSDMDLMSPLKIDQAFLNKLLPGLELNCQNDFRTKTFQSKSGLLEIDEIGCRLSYLLAEIKGIPVVLAQKVPTAKSGKRKHDGHVDEKSIRENESDMAKVAGLYYHDLTFNPWKIHSWFQLGLLHRGLGISQRSTDRACKMILHLYHSNETDFGYLESKRFFEESNRLFMVCLRSWMTVSKLTDYELVHDKANNSVGCLEAFKVLPLWTSVCFISNSSAETRGIISRVNDDNTYDVSHEDDRGIQYHVERQKLNIRTPWSQLDPGTEHYFVSECLELLGNTIFTNLGIQRRLSHQPFRKLCATAIWCYSAAVEHHEKQAMQTPANPNENTFACLHMNARVLSKLHLSWVWKEKDRNVLNKLKWNKSGYGDSSMEIPYEIMNEILGKFAQALSTLDQLHERKNSTQIANRLSRKEIFYHLHSLRVKILFLHTNEDCCLLPPSQILDILENFRFSSQEGTKSERSSRKLKELDRVYSIISDCIAAFKSIEDWNYKAVYRHAWTVSKAAYMEQHCTLVHRDAYTLKSALDLFDAIICKKVVASSKTVKGANVLWNPKLIEYIEHLIKPRCKYEAVRYKVVATYVDICVNASYYQKLYELYSALKAARDDFSRDHVLMRSASLCLKGMVRILSESLKIVVKENSKKTPLKASVLETEKLIEDIKIPREKEKVLSNEAETLLKNSFVLYLESMDMTCIISATLAKLADNTLQTCTTLLTDAFEKLILVDIKVEQRTDNDILSKAINFCDKIAPEHKGKVKLSKMKLRLKKRHKTKPQASSKETTGEDIPPPPPGPTQTQESSQRLSDETKSKGDDNDIPPPPPPRKRSHERSQKVENAPPISKASTEPVIRENSSINGTSPPSKKRSNSETESNTNESKKQKKGIIIRLKLKQPSAET